MVKNQIFSIGLLILAVLFAVGALLVPLAFPIALVAACICCAFSVMLSPSLWVIGCGVLLSFAVGWFVLGSVWGAMAFVVAFLSIGISVGLGLRNKKRFNDVIAQTALSSAVLATLNFLVYIGEASGGTFDSEAVLKPMFENAEIFLKSIFDVGNPAVNDIFAAYGVSAEQYVETVFNMGVFLVPTLYMGAVLLISVVSFWIIKSIMIRTEEPVSFMGTFDDFTVSRTFLWTYLICNILYLFMDDSIFGIAAMNFSNIMTFVFAYGGVSLFSYLMVYKNVSKLVRRIVVVIAIFACTMPGILNLISMVGFIDVTFSIRERLSNSGV